MDLLLRGRGADISARAPLWLIRLCGAAAGFAIYSLADLLGMREVTGLSAVTLFTMWALFGAVIAPTRAGSILWPIMGLEAAIICLVSFTPVMQGPAQHYVRRDAGDAPVDAVVVLSASVSGEGLISSLALNRLVSGISEARRRNVRTIAVSVVDFRTPATYVTSQVDQKQLLSTLAPDLELLFVRDVFSTRDEALNFVALGRTHGWQRVAVVTSPLHSRRSCRTFEKAGIAVTCAPAMARDYSVTRMGGMLARLNVFRDVMYETAATMLYSMRGWI